MLCSRCQSKVESDYKFCPHCGARLDSVITQAEDPSSSIPEATMKKKPMPFWFKLISLLAILALVGVTAGILFTESWVDVVDHQLEALKQQDISKAYSAYTSKEFQDTTSLEHFHNFIEAYPVFMNNQSAHFTKRSIEGNIGTLRGKLTSNEHIETPIEYKLIKEDGKWKILSIRLLKPGTIQNAKESAHSENLIEIAKGQLRDIQDQKLKEAYENFSSQEFKEATSVDSFKEFIKRYPILKDYKVVSFHKPTVRNGVGTLSVILHSQELAAYVKYYFTFEDQKWKIWSMRILSPSESEEGLEAQEKVQQLEKSAAEPMSFKKISLGDKVDQSGQIQDPKTSFSGDLTDLYVDIEVKDGIKGSMIYLNLKHPESGSSIPAQASIEEDGDTMLMSVFSPPPNGWPKGHYQLEVRTSSGLKKDIDFEME